MMFFSLLASTPSDVEGNVNFRWKQVCVYCYFTQISFEKWVEEQAARTQGHSEIYGIWDHSGLDLGSQPRELGSQPHNQGSQTPGSRFQVMESQDQFTEIKVQTFPRFWDQGSVFGVKKWVSWRKRIPRYGPVKLVQRFLWFTYPHNRTDRTLTSELSLLCNIIGSRKDYSKSKTNNVLLKDNF